jgi:membrane protease subunit (stomatin/prohibitin family)
MGLFDFIQGEFIDVIGWLDPTEDTIVWRFPDEDHAIKMGAKLTVREGQVAVFINEGTIADVFKPGLFTLTTQNLPILTKLRSWKYGFDSPFKAEVYFVSTRNFLDMKWGTQNPIMTRDADFGVVRLRAFGTYGMRVTDAGVFLKEVVGTDGDYTRDKIEGQLRSMLVAAFTQMLTKANIPALDLAANYASIGDQARGQMDPEFQRFGLSLTRFLIENISVPPEVEKMLDTRSKMGIVGDMGKYMQFQTADSIPEAAASGGTAGAAMGMGAGVAMGQQMMAGMAASMTPTQPSQPQQTGAPAPPAAAAGKFCAECGKSVAVGAKFCAECGAPQKTGCPKCGANTPPNAKFCAECGEKIA